ncbi:hypothetical protein HZR84_13995 [Hyphobacterium sp. CCMP332]|nr:hypothetical protein HZR84_13995 [Hyphobacterium sp. CCMP332]
MKLRSFKNQWVLCFPFLLLIAFSIFTSCSESEDNPGPNNGGSASGLKFFSVGNASDAHGVYPVSSGGYIIAGKTLDEQRIGNDGLLIKLKPSLEQEWTKTYNFVGSVGNQEFQDVVETNDGGFAMAGSYKENTNYYNFLLAKVDKDGNELWNWNYWSSTNDFDDQAYSLEETSSGGFVLSGNCQSCIQVVVTGSDGQISGIKQYKEVDNFKFGVTGGHYSHISQTQDGGYLFHGSISGSSGTNAEDPVTVVYKIDGGGVEQWNRRYKQDDKISATNIGLFVESTSDGGYIILQQRGDVTSNGINTALLLLIKTNSNGDEEWRVPVNEDEISPGLSFEVVQTMDGGFVLAYAESDQSGGFSYISIKKFDSSGQELWKRIHGKDRFNRLAPTDIKLCPDGGFIVTGSDNNGLAVRGIFVLKTNSEGN